mgnify:CR=1 FL=1
MERNKVPRGTPEGTPLAQVPSPSNSSSPGVGCLAVASLICNDVCGPEHACLGGHDRKARRVVARPVPPTDGPPRAAPERGGVAQACSGVPQHRGDPAGSCSVRQCAHDSRTHLHGGPFVRGICEARVPTQRVPGVAFRGFSPNPTQPPSQTKCEVPSTLPSLMSYPGLHPKASSIFGKPQSSKKCRTRRSFSFLPENHRAETLKLRLVNANVEVTTAGYHEVGESLVARCAKACLMGTSRPSLSPFAPECALVVAYCSSVPYITRLEAARTLIRASRYAAPSARYFLKPNLVHR